MGSKSFSDEVFSGNYARCADTHPPLVVGKFKIYGGSASHPVHRDAGLYISLQEGSRSGCATAPWDTTVAPVYEYPYIIQDMGVPKNVPRFKKMVTYICNQLQAGVKVHVGCIGGHGRTGLVLAAVVAEMTDIKDAISYVRKNYCSRAVESKQQVDFLVEHYGVTKVAGAKEHGHGFSSHHGGTVYTPRSDYGKSIAAKNPIPFGAKSAINPDKPKGATRTITPVSSARNLFKKRKKTVAA